MCSEFQFSCGSFCMVVSEHCIKEGGLSVPFDWGREGHPWQRRSDGFIRGGSISDFPWLGERELSDSRREAAGGWGSRVCDSIPMDDGRLSCRCCVNESPDAKCNMPGWLIFHPHGWILENQLQYLRMMNLISTNFHKRMPHPYILF